MDRQLSPLELGKEFEDVEMKSFKDHVAMRIADYLSSYRERYNEILNGDVSTGKLEVIARDGGFKAKQSASGTLERVYKLIGLRE